MNASQHFSVSLIHREASVSGALSRAIAASSSKRRSAWRQVEDGWAWCYPRYLKRPEECLPREQARWAPLVVPVFMPMVKRALHITPETTVRSRDRIDAVFEEVGHRLADGRPFLAGERFSAADLTFAALSAPVLLPPECPAYPPVADLPAAMHDGVERWRATAAGRFGLTMYARWRRSGMQ